jgi:hypothetical protein
MPLKTIQIALLGGTEDAVFVGLRNFPAHKVALVTLRESMQQASQLADRLTGSLRLAVDIIQVNDVSIQTILKIVSQIVRKESGNFQDFLLNVGSGNRCLTCAGVTAAFIHGVKAFDVKGDEVIILPVMKFPYTEAITEPKMEILRAIERSGGDVESLEKLIELSGYGKTLLSHHIRGCGDGRHGLEVLGLVDVERGKRGRLRVKLTALGRIILSSDVSPV